MRGRASSSGGAPAAAVLQRRARQRGAFGRLQASEGRGAPRGEFLRARHEGVDKEGPACWWLG